MFRRMLCLLSLATAPVQAAEYCVASYAELSAALQLAAISPVDDEVRIVAGDYALGGNVTFWPVFADSDAQPTGALALSGGWAPGCSTQALGAPSTVLRGTAPGHYVDLSPTASLLVSDLTFVDVFGGVTLDPATSPAFPLDIDVRASRLAILSDGSQTYGLRVAADAAEITVENVLVNARASCALGLKSGLPDAIVSVWSSTMVNRPLDDGSAGAAVCFESGSPNVANVLVNSILSTAGVDLLVDGAPVLAQHSVYGDAAACQQCGDAIDAASFGNFVREESLAGATGTVAGQFADLRDQTAAQGDLADSGTDSDITFPADVEGNPRPSQGTTPSRGAFQLADVVPGDALFANGFESP